MLKNYLIIAIRHLNRHKFFSIINICCLALGITFSMIVGIYVFNQESINTGLRNADNQYIVKSKWKEKNMGLEITSISPLAKTMKEEYPGLVANYYRYCPVTNVISAGDKYFKEDIAICDTTLISVYGFPLLYGNKENAFPNNNSAVITETMAMKLFGKKDALNKTISMQTTVAGVLQHYIVSAVLKDIPFNSVTHLFNSGYNMFVPTTGNRYFSGGDPSLSWDNANEVSMIELKPGVNPASLERPVKQTLKKYSSDFIWKNLDIELSPLKNYYIRDNDGAVQKMIITLSLIAVFILLMAIINFVNINIGTSAYRLKEIGLRKVFGSVKKQLIVQFITEAWLLTFIAAAISVALYQLLLPVFSQVLNTNLHPFWHFGFGEYILLFALITGIGFISGIYPAFVLSSANLVNAVKGKPDSTKGGLGLRKTLLVVQFSLTIIVFICTLNVSRQVSYIFNKDLGYDKEQLLVIAAFPKQWDSAGVLKMESIKQGLLQLNAVKSASLAFDIPESMPNGRIILYRSGSSGAGSQLSIPIAPVDEDYAKTYGMQLRSGIFFQQDGGAYIPDQIVLNETAVKELGLKPETAAGKKINSLAGSLTIAGVVKDFNYSSMQQKIGPVAFAHIKSQNIFRYLTLKLSTSDVSGAMKEIKDKWKTLSPNAPFEYEFMDEKFQFIYQSELKLKKAANIATILNLIIVFLGIIGIVAFTLTRRNKEIAVRRVLGAGAGQIIYLFIKEYVWLILIANIIAWPLAYGITNKWLENYAYRIQQNISPYLLVCAFIFMMAFALIGAQCFKVASANPVRSLRTE